MRQNKSLICLSNERLIFKKLQQTLEKFFLLQSQMRGIDFFFALSQYQEACTFALKNHEDSLTRGFERTAIEPERHCVGLRVTPGLGLRLKKNFTYRTRRTPQNTNKSRINFLQAFFFSLPKYQASLLKTGQMKKRRSVVVIYIENIFSGDQRSS